jgi:hypothetical protein
MDLKSKPISNHENRFLPDILVSDDLGNQFPIYSFDVFVVVEPNETTLIRENDLDLSLFSEELAREYCERMSQEALLTEATVPGHEQSIWPDRTRIIWLRNSTSNIFRQYGMDTAYLAFQFDENHQITDDLRWYLQAASESFPHWRVAVAGGMLEDEVVYVANVFRKYGFKTTVLTRYCLSKKVVQLPSKPQR